MSVGRRRLRKTSEKGSAKRITVNEILVPDFIVFCQDYVRGIDNDISIIKTVDYLCPRGIPYTPKKFIVLASFYRNPAIGVSEFRDSLPEFRLVIYPPHKQPLYVGPFRIASDSRQSPWLVERLIIDLSDAIEFTSSGPYRFVIEGKTETSDYEAMQWRLLPITESESGKKQITVA